MAEEPDHNLLKKLVEAEPQVIKTTPADVSISVPDGKGGENEYIWPENASNALMLASVCHDLSMPFKPIYQERFLEGVEEVKKSLTKEFELEVGIKNLAYAKIKVKRAPKKKIKRYTEIKGTKGRNSIKN